MVMFCPTVASPKCSEPSIATSDWVLALQTVHAARIEQANGSARAGVVEERVLPDHKASLREKDAELQV